MVTSKELQELRDGNFEIQCPRMSLVQNVKDAPVTYEGSGLVQMDDSRGLVATLLAPDAPPPMSELSVAREPIPDERYFTLRAEDLWGHQWQSERLVLDPTYNVSTGSAVVKAQLRTIYTESASASQRRNSNVVIHIFHALRLPYDQRTDTVTNIAGHEQRSASVNVTTFEAIGLQFLCREDNGVIVEANETALEMPANLELRIIEALQFLTATEVTPSLVTTSTPTHLRFTVHSGPTTRLKPRRRPPLNLDNHSITKWAWALFEKYLEYVSSWSEPEFHPLSREWDAVIKSQFASVDTQVLILAIAVEALLRHTHPQYDQTPLTTEEQEWKTRIEKLINSDACPKSLANRVSGFVGSLDTPLTAEEQEWSTKIDDLINSDACPESFANRVSGFLGNLDQVRAVDKLYNLANDGAINRGSIEAWKDLRHRRAHGSSSEKLAIEEVLHLRDEALSLLYEITFDAIGYHGPRVNYGAPGGPEEDFYEGASTHGQSEWESKDGAVC